MRYLGRASEVRSWTVVAAITVIVASAVWSVDDLPALARDDVFHICVFAAAIILGELTRITTAGRHQSASLSTAAGLAFAMTVELPGGAVFDQPSSVVVVAAGLAITVGTALQYLRGRRPRVHESAARLVCVAGVSFLYRRVEWGDVTIVQWQQEQQDRWQVAVIMVLVGLVGLAVEIGLLALVRAQRDHTAARAMVREEVTESWAILGALVSAGALTALAQRSLGLLAIPLFLAPFALTHFAVRRQFGIRDTKRQTLRALSRVTEYGGYTRRSHSQRVCDLALAVGRDLGMHHREISDLETAALLHDLGQVALREPIPGGATVLAAPDDQRRIAMAGAGIVQQTGVLAPVVEILEHQITPYRQLREFGQQIPVGARVLKVANAYDDLTAGSRTLRVEQLALERIHLGLGYEYDPAVVEALVRVLERRRRGRIATAGA